MVLYELGAGLDAVGVQIAARIDSILLTDGKG